MHAAPLYCCAQLFNFLLHISTLRVTLGARSVTTRLKCWQKICRQHLSVELHVRKLHVIVPGVRKSPNPMHVASIDELALRFCIYDPLSCLEVAGLP